MVETCGFFGTFIETRYGGYPVPVPPGDEKVAYDVHCFCGLIDSDGMACVLDQPQAERRAMFRSLRKLGMAKLVDFTKKAATALRRSGRSLHRKQDRSAISGLLRPFEDIYFKRLRTQAYSRLYRHIISSEAFIPYMLNCERMEKEGGNPFDPKEWTPEKLKDL